MNIRILEVTTEKDNTNKIYLPYNEELKVIFGDKLNTEYVDNIITSDNKSNKIFIDYQQTDDCSQIYGIYRDKTHGLYNTFTFLKDKWYKTYYDELDDLKKDDIYDEFMSYHIVKLISHGWFVNYKSNGCNFFSLANAYDFCNEKTLIKEILNFEKTKVYSCWVDNLKTFNVYSDIIHSGVCVYKKDELMKYTNSEEVISLFEENKTICLINYNF